MELATSGRWACGLQASGEAARPGVQTWDPEHKETRDKPHPTIPGPEIKIGDAFVQNARLPLQGTHSEMHELHDRKKGEGNGSFPNREDYRRKPGGLKPTKRDRPCGRPGGS